VAKRDWTLQPASSLTHLMYDHIPTIRARIICFYNSVVSLSYWASNPFYAVYATAITFPPPVYQILSYPTSFHSTRVLHPTLHVSGVWTSHHPTFLILFLHPIHAVIHFILKPAHPYFYDSLTYSPSQSLFCYISSLGSSRAVFVLPSPTSSWFSASFWC